MMKKVPCKKIYEAQTLGKMNAILHKYYLAVDYNEFYKKICDKVKSLVTINKGDFYKDNSLILRNTKIDALVCNQLIKYFIECSYEKIQKHYTEIYNIEQTTNEDGKIEYFYTFGIYRSGEVWPERKYLNIKFYNVDSIFTFGKYEGQSLAEIFKINPSYIFDYCLCKHDNFFIAYSTFKDLLQINPEYRLSRKAMATLSKKLFSLNPRKYFFNLTSEINFGKYFQSNKNLIEIFLADPSFIEAAILFYSEFFIEYKTLYQLYEIKGDYRFANITVQTAIQKEQYLKKLNNEERARKEEIEELDRELDYLEGLEKYFERASDSKGEYNCACGESPCMCSDPDPG